MCAVDFSLWSHTLLTLTLGFVVVFSYLDTNKMMMYFFIYIYNNKGIYIYTGTVNFNLFSFVCLSLLCSYFSAWFLFCFCFLIKYFYLTFVPWNTNRTFIVCFLQIKMAEDVSRIQFCMLQLVKCALTYKWGVRKFDYYSLWAERVVDTGLPVKCYLRSEYWFWTFLEKQFFNLFLKICRP